MLERAVANQNGRILGESVWGQAREAHFLSDPSAKTLRSAAVREERARTSAAQRARRQSRAPVAELERAVDAVFTDVVVDFKEERARLDNLRNPPHS